MSDRMPSTSVGDSLGKTGMIFRCELKDTRKAFNNFRSKQQNCVK